MTSLVEDAIERLRGLPPDLQDDLARLLLQMSPDGQPPDALTVDEEAAVLRSRAAAERGEFATDEQVRAVWAKHGL